MVFIYIHEYANEIILDMEPLHERLCQIVSLMMQKSNNCDLMILRLKSVYLLFFYVFPLIFKVFIKISMIMQIR